MSCYILDANTVLQLSSHFPTTFGQLGKLVRQGTVKFPEGVYNELTRKSDKLKRKFPGWAQKYPQMIVRFDKHSEPRLREELSRIEQEYGRDFYVGQQLRRGFWKSRAGRKAAEGQVVAAAKVLRCVAVSDDVAVEGACSLEGVSCIGWAEFARQVGLIEHHMKSLFESAGGDL
jgi:hypothetical protein